MNKQPIIIECELPDDVLGRYAINDQLILVHDIKDKSILIHEMTHHLWHKQDPKLGRFLRKNLKLNYNSSNSKVVNSRKIRQKVDVHMVMTNYESDDWFNEVIAYYMGSLSPKMLRQLNFPLFNKILDGEFVYETPNGDIIWKKTGEILDNIVSVKNILEFYRKNEWVK